jgi:hypothetical protein
MPSTKVALVPPREIVWKASQYTAKVLRNCSLHCANKIRLKYPLFNTMTKIDRNRIGTITAPRIVAFALERRNRLK